MTGAASASQVTEREQLVASKRVSGEGAGSLRSGKPGAADTVYEGTIVAVGDSLTAGLRVDEDQAYPAQLARRLKADGYAFRVVNAGVSGETSSGTLARIQWVMTALKPDIVILETGANDGLRGIDPHLLAGNLDQLLTRLKAAGIQVVLAGMRMLPNLGAEYTRAFARVYPEQAQKHQVLLMPFFLEGVAGEASLSTADKDEGDDASTAATDKEKGSETKDKDSKTKAD